MTLRELCRLFDEADLGDECAIALLQGLEDAYGREISLRYCLRSDEDLELPGDWPVTVAWLFLRMQGSCAMRAREQLQQIFPDLKEPSALADGVVEPRT